MHLNTQNFIIIFLACLSLGSCTTFHTPLSRSIFENQERLPGSETQSLPEPKKNEAVRQLNTPNETPNETSNYKTSFDWPVDNARMTRGFLPHKKKPHLGLDLAAPKGTPIMASRAGTVIYAGREFRGFGRMILIESGDGWATLYAHLDKILIAEGQKVRQGEVLGAMGRSGHATGVHLHFEIRKDRGPIDPLPLLPNGDKIAQMASHKSS